ncbi:AAA family ATPase [Luteimonas sp. SJ-92]|uniref:AAA family ATPase n=1 Tax=Luteimonas salinisoli TaxID=2752307 RepID=A0A853J9Z5_9GAMM|nr:AAA family ATPase [Luteimonas salinisoli]NZA25499.1 AAA family ATPase [Luteimonas salinisoli]
MGSLAIRRVQYSGAKYSFSSPEFGPGLSIVEGPNGSGKSTFFNLIYFGLGGRVPEFETSSNEVHKEIVGDTNNFVHLAIAVNGRRYGLTRRIGENWISVSPLSDAEHAVTETLPIFRREADQKTFSDWLLEGLEIPVVEITQGTRTFKLNFTDLARLIFHNQSPDPHGVFKPAEVTSNFVSDSLEVRRAIFQILVGKTLLSLYVAYSKLKRAERDREAARLVLAEYTEIVTQVSRANGITEVINGTHLRARIAELAEQAQKLLAERAAVLGSGVRSTDIVVGVEIAKKDYELALQRQAELQNRLQELFNEKARLDEVRFVLREEIDRIEKILYTHEQLKLFSADTCPYCLSTVERAADRCVCGSHVDESQYQRFFYSASEYVEILSSKAKSLQTLDAAGLDIRNETASVAESLGQATEESRRLRDALSAIADEASDQWSPDERMSQIEETLFSVRDQIGSLEQALRLEEKLAGYQRRLTTTTAAVDDARREVSLLDAAARQELSGRISEFDEVYSEMMQTVLENCRTAFLDTNSYLPVVNNKEYREASADVPKRFLYYLTLLMLSVREAIPFPRLLLVDTPETAGIDQENLIKNLRQISKIPDDADFQILLSTGVGKFPPEFADRVRIRLSKESKLLQVREASEG